MGFPIFLPDFLGYGTSTVAPPTSEAIEQSVYGGDYLGEFAYGGNLVEIVQPVIPGEQRYTGRSDFGGVYLGLTAFGGAFLDTMEHAAVLGRPPTKGELTKVETKSIMNTPSSSSTLTLPKSTAEITIYRTRADYYYG